FGAAQRRSSCRNESFSGICDAAGCCGTRTHAAPRRCRRHDAHRATSMAHVLWVVYRHRILFPGARKSPAEISSCGGTSPTDIPVGARPGSALVPGCAAALVTDFLADSHSLLQEAAVSSVTISNSCGLPSYRLTRSDFGILIASEP